MFQYHSTSQKDDPLIDHHGIQRDNFAYVFAFQYAVEGAEKCGVTDFVIITGTNMDSLEDHFDFATELEELLETKHNDKMLEEIRRTNKAKPP